MIGSLENYNGELLLGKINTENILLLNVIYHRPTKDTQWKDYASVVIKDVSTGEKRLITMKEPEMIMYLEKPEFRDHRYVPAFRPLTNCDQIRVKYDKVIERIAVEAGEAAQEYYEQCKRRNYRALKNLHKYPYILGSDYDYPSYFRAEWMLHYHNPNIPKQITKTYLDIEVDLIDAIDKPDPRICPINAVSLVDDYGETVYVFLLRNEKNPLIQEFESNLSGFVERCHASFDESYGRLEYEILLFDDEVEMITELFHLIHNLDRDFCMIWNMAFDIPFIINRLKALGKDPKEIMCDPAFVQKELYYREDHIHFDFKTRNDTFIFSCKTVFLDQMSQYIKIRKQQAELKSIKLNVIAKRELNDEKLDYSDFADIKTLAYRDYNIFVLYNIKDTLLLKGIENKTHDIDVIFDRALTNATQYPSVFSQTILLKNRAYISYYKQGFIIGNNRNIQYGEKEEEDPLLNEDEDNTKEEDKFGGGLVGEPSLNEHVGVHIFGKRSSYIFSKVIDFDYKSMYPLAVYIAHNIGHETEIGKIVLEGFDHLDRDPSNKIYDGGKMYAEALTSQDYAYIGKTYFHLPGFEELLEEMEHAAI